jgi:hypothetical protein
MEKDQFIDTEKKSWWLLETEIDPALEQKRKTLGECWDWTDLLWYTERLKMEEVYQFLEVNKSELLRELDEANDLYRRDIWLDSVIHAKRPPKQHVAPQEPTAGKAADVQAKPAVGAPPTAPAKKPSAFGRAKPTEESAAEPAAGGPAAAGVAAGGQAVEPKKPSPFGRKPAAAEAPARPAAREGVGAGEPLPPVSEQIQSVMSDLSADELSSIARDLGLTAAEVEAMVKDPDFAGMVAEEQAQLERS